MKINTSTLLILFTFASCFLVISCVKRQAKLVKVTTPITVVDTCSSISFSKTILPMVITNCSSSQGCHGNGSSHVALVDYASLNTEFTTHKLTYTNNAILGKGLDMSTQEASLSTSQINQFICWLKNNAPNN
ncbi:MAG: hypothetical protein RL708_1177 [Bacteroidota bacterium]|jgi:hypothetical protein